MGAYPTVKKWLFLDTSRNTDEIMRNQSDRLADGDVVLVGQCGIVFYTPRFGRHQA